MAKRRPSLAFLVAFYFNLDILPSSFLPHLLRHQVRDAARVFPLPEEELAEERIQRLLLAAELLVPAAVLLPQRAEEPLQHEQRALRRLRLRGRRNEEGRVLSPVRRVLRQRRRRQNERRRSQGRQVTRKGCN